MLFFVNPLWQALTLSPWLLMVLLFLHKTNRRRSALWILLPLLAAPIVARVLGAVLIASQIAEPGDPATYLYPPFGLFGAGLGTLILASPALIGRKAITKLIAAFMLPCILGITGLVACHGIPLFTDIYHLAGIVGIVAYSGILVLGLFVAAFFCRRSHRYFWFALVLALSMTLVIAPSLLLFPLIVSADETDFFLAALLAIAIIPLVLPFLALTYLNSFYRRRFEALLGWKPAANT